MSFLLPASAGWNAGGIKACPACPVGGNHRTGVELKLSYSSGVPGFSGTKKHRVNLPARALIPPTFSLQPSAFSFRV